MNTYPPATDTMAPNSTLVAHPPTTSPLSLPKTLSKNDLMIGLKERWSEDNRPFHFQHALAVLMGYIGLLRSHDAPLVHRATGFPLGFVSRVILELLRSPIWHSDGGFVDLIRLAEDTDVKEFDSVVGELISSALFGDGIYSELEKEWYRLMGVTIEL